MFASIPSVDVVVQCLLPAFTQPSFQTHVEVFLGWVMCLGRRTEYGVDGAGLAREVAVTIVLRLNPKGLLYLVVDDTLLHKRGKHVWGLGWFRDAVASTAKRVATASGNHWVVIGLAIRIPGTEKIYCLPIHARLHLPGQGQPGEATLAAEEQAGSRAEAFRGVGHRMVSRPHAPRSSCHYPRSYNYPNLGYKSRPAAITQTT